MTLQQFSKKGFCDTCNNYVQTFDDSGLHWDCALELSGQRRINPGWGEDEPCPYWAEKGMEQ